MSIPPITYSERRNSWHFRVALNGVILVAPGGPEEDPTGGFALGGWMFNYWDEAMDLSAAGFTGQDGEGKLVMGRKRRLGFVRYQLCRYNGGLNSILITTQHGE
ncbi:hypothetical protein [Zobellella iuensis]|uniref:Dirigent protein n=1 Tax=Zobellella iuensis TaxID=2803811 RepID=A0ABS1QRJ5_9GAMM|nr:hypothetical protein [Zobellella iuensis]MBL1377406.1 hypothetical protein [Zobellella iuensis]